MVMVDTVLLAAYGQACGSSRLAWSKGQLPPGAMLYLSCEPSEISQWLAVMTAL